MNERDDNAELFDQADTFDNLEDTAYDDLRQRELDEEREQMTEAALDACRKAGVEVEHLRTLARETGCYRWALEHSLKG